MLYALDKQRDAELEVASSPSIIIDEYETSAPLPTSLTLLKSVKLPAKPLSVCHYKGSTYVGLKNKTVARIDSNYQLYRFFITGANYVVCCYL